jgi:hypothetical protein
MELETIRERQLDTYLKNASAQDDQKLRIPLKGKAEHLQVYRVPMKYLIYNIRNGRFAAELLEKESQLKRKLDPGTPGDAKTIQKLLLDLNQSETEALKADLRDNGQLDPGVTTKDGAVINGNRRMAILTALHDETHDPKFEYLRIARLPKDVDEKELWRIEAGLQFAKEFRLDYSPINELLKLREGRDSGFSAAEISKTLLGRFTPSKVEEKLAILKLIDSYLHFIGRPGQYHIVQDERDVEKFNSLQANVVAPLKRKGKKDAEIAKLVAFAFLLINKTDHTHWDIRLLNRVAVEKVACDELLKDYDANKPFKSQMTKDELEGNFTTAKEIVEAEEQQGRPERLMKKALSALRSIRSDNPRLAWPEMKSLAAELKREIDRLLTAAGNR